MHKKQHTTNTSSDHTGPARRAWTVPTATYRGSVAELVQIAKTSGNQDCSGHKRRNSGSHC